MPTSIFILPLLAAALFAAAVKYDYDSAGRLTRVDYGDGRTITYTYDKNGNLLKREATGGAADSPSRAPAKKAQPAKPRPGGSQQPCSNSHPTLRLLFFTSSRSNIFSSYFAGSSDSRFATSPMRCVFEFVLSCVCGITATNPSHARNRSISFGAPPVATSPSSARPVTKPSGFA